MNLNIATSELCEKTQNELKVITFNVVFEIQMGGGLALLYCGKAAVRIRSPHRIETRWRYLRGSRSSSCQEA